MRIEIVDSTKKAFDAIKDGADIAIYPHNTWCGVYISVRRPDAVRHADSQNGWRFSIERDGIVCFVAQRTTADEARKIFEDFDQPPLVDVGSLSVV